MAAGKEDYNLKLRQAAATGNLKTLESLLAKGAEINSCGASGNTALHFAAMRGHYLAVEFLVSKGADIDLKNNKESNPETALETAIASKDSNKETVKFLSLVKPLREAIQYAKSVFPDETSDEEHYHLLSGKALELESSYEPFAEKIKESLYKCGCEKKDRQQQTIIAQEYNLYALFIFTMAANLKVFSEANFKGGFCGLRAAAAFYYLTSQKDLGYPIESVTISSLVYPGGHQVLMIGREPESELHELATSKYAIFCDTYEHGAFYSSRNVPSTTCVEGIVKRNSIYETQISKKPDTTLAKFKHDHLDEILDNELKNIASILPEPIFDPKGKEEKSPDLSEVHNQRRTASSSGRSPRGR